MREAMEEFGQTIEIVDHFYTTDFFQKALFYDDHQLISIYYLCKFMTPPMFKISSVPFDFKPVNGAQSFRYVNIKSTSVEELSFPVDRVVFEMLKKKQINKAL
jgi:hypothetical protein